MSIAPGLFKSAYIDLQMPTVNEVSATSRLWIVRIRLHGPDYLGPLPQFRLIYVQAHAYEQYLHRVLHSFISPSTKNKLVLVAVLISPCV